jgi:hypothetical protein
MNVLRNLFDHAQQRMQSALRPVLLVASCIVSNEFRSVFDTFCENVRVHTRSSSDEESEARTDAPDRLLRRTCVCIGRFP